MQLSPAAVAAETLSNVLLHCVALGDGNPALGSSTTIPLLVDMVVPAQASSPRSVQSGTIPNPKWFRPSLWADFSGRGK